MTSPFGRTIRQIRRAKRMSLGAVATPLGWSQPYFSDIETGRRNAPGPDRVEQIAAILGVPERCDELKELAMLSRGSVVLRLDPGISTKTARAFIMLGSLHQERRLKGETISGILRLLEANAGEGDQPRRLGLIGQAGVGPTS